MTITLSQLRSRLGEPESGMVTAFVVIFTLALIVMAFMLLAAGSGALSLDRRLGIS